jgi:hypothetical protein
VLGEAHALGGEPVDVGCADLLLTVTARFAVSQVIGQNKYNIGFVPGTSAPGDPSRHGQRQCTRSNDFEKLPPLQRVALHENLLAELGNMFNWEW